MSDMLDMARGQVCVELESSTHKLILQKVKLKEVLTTTEVNRPISEHNFLLTPYRQDLCLNYPCVPDVEYRV